MRSNLAEFIFRVPLAAAFALVVAGCGGDDEGKTARETATAIQAAESNTPAPQLNTPAPTSSESAPGEIETAARNLLADEVEVDEGELKLNSFEGVAWSDTSLGCPQEGMAYAQVITPGYKLIFDLAGNSYAVHSNSDGSHMVICSDGQ